MQSTSWYGVLKTYVRIKNHLMRDPVPGPLDALRERFLRSEGWVKREQYQPRQEWKITHCLACGKKIKYIPKDKFNGTLKCPECGIRFKVPNLLYF